MEGVSYFHFLFEEEEEEKGDSYKVRLLQIKKDDTNAKGKYLFVVFHAKQVCSSYISSSNKF